MVWRIARLLVLAAFSLSVSPAQPFIFYRGILNAASYVPAGLPNGSIARGSIFAIFGRDLGPAESATVSSFPLGTSFENVSIEVCASGNCTQAIPIYVQAGQINGVMPSDAPMGAVSVRVTYNGTAGNFSPATVVASSFGAFAINSGGFGPGVVQNFTPDALPINSPAAPAAAGQTVILWGTGLGAGLNADNVAPQAGDLPVPVEIWVGGKPVLVKRYSGRTPCCAGIDQIVFDLPPDTPAGCYVPVTIRSGGVVSNDTTISVSAPGQPCSNAPDSFQQRLRQGGKLGSMSLLHTRPAEGGAAFEVASAFFGEEAGGLFAYDPSHAELPAGACIVEQTRNALVGANRIAASGRELDPGSAFLVEAPQGDALLKSRGPLGGFNWAGPAPPPGELVPSIVDAGSNVQIAGAGGADIGPVDFSLPVPEFPEWTNAAGLTAVDRQRDLAVTWRAVDEPGAGIWIVGTSIAAGHDATASFFCFVSADRGSFTIPSYVLARLPASDPHSFQPLGLLGVGLTRADSTLPLTPAGLDYGVVSATSMTTVSVEYR